MTTTQVGVGDTFEQTQFPSARPAGSYSARAFPIRREAEPSAGMGWIQGVPNLWFRNAKTGARYSNASNFVVWASELDTIQRNVLGYRVSNMVGATAFSVGDLERNLLELLDTTVLCESDLESTETVSQHWNYGLPQDRVVLVAYEPLEVDDLKFDILDPIADELLKEALNDLDRVVAEAGQDGFPIPPSGSVEDARRLVRAMYGIWSRRFEIYPTEEGEISIDAPSGYGRLLVVVCSPDGSVQCSLVLDGDYRSEKYDSADELLDEFLREALLTLRHEFH